MQRYSSLLLAPLVVFLSGCAGQLADMPYSRQRLMNYSLGETKEASIGDPIIEVENASVRDAYEATTDYQTPSLGIFGFQQISLKKGDRFTAVAYNPKNSDAIYIRQEGPEKQTLLIQIHADGKINNGWVLVDGTIPVQGSWTNKQIFKKSKTPSRGEGSFKAQIIYSGMAGNTVKAVYREFSNDFARPAFTQDLQYNLDEEKVISYKTVKVAIVKATNSSIQYRVLEDGGLPWMPR